MRAIYRQDSHPPLTEEDLERHNDETAGLPAQAPGPAVTPAQRLLRRRHARCIRGVLVTSTDPAERQRNQARRTEQA
jgi:hypothetical protein